MLCQRSSLCLIFYYYISFLYFLFKVSCYIFVSASRADNSKLEELIEQFVATGSRVVDDLALRSLSITVARLAQDYAYMSSIEKLNLMNPIIELLLSLMTVS